MGDKQKKIKVMLVDEHTLVREALVHLLSAQKGFDVVADTGRLQEVSSLVKRHKPELLLTELATPSMGGLELTRELLQAYPGLKVVFLTSQVHEEFAMRGLRAGALGYLLKEEDSTTFFEALHKIHKGEKIISPRVSERIALHVTRENGEDDHSQLSDREFQVLRGLAVGKDCRELADTFSLSVKTIYTYRTRILKKLGLKNDIGLLRYAWKHKLLEDEQAFV